MSFIDGLKFHECRDNTRLLRDTSDRICLEHGLSVIENPKGKRVSSYVYIEAEVCPDHVHMLLEIPPKFSVSGFMGYLKGKSSTMIYEQFGDLKYKYRNREFWCKGYYVDTTGKNTGRIAEYIQHQLDEDKLGEQLSIPEAKTYRKKKK